MVADKKARTDGADPSGIEEKFLAIEKLHEIQEELDKINEEASEEVLAIVQQYHEKRKPLYAKRKGIINEIPNFWLTAFMSHPALGEMLTEEDQEIFTYLESLDVDFFDDVRKGYSITFNFKPNPFFENTNLTKTIKISDEGTLRRTGTTINWKKGKGPFDGSEYEKMGNKRPLLKDSFFKWFTNEDPGVVEQDQVAEVIKEEVFPNPVDYLNYNDDDEEEEDTDEDEDDEGEDDDEDEDGSKPDV